MKPTSPFLFPFVALPAQYMTAQTEKRNVFLSRDKNSGLSLVFEKNCSRNAHRVDIYRRNRVINQREQLVVRIFLHEP